MEKFGLNPFLMSLAILFVSVSALPCFYNNVVTASYSDDSSFDPEEDDEDGLLLQSINPNIDINTNQNPSSFEFHEGNNAEGNIEIIPENPRQKQEEITPVGAFVKEDADLNTDKNVITNNSMAEENVNNSNEEKKEEKSYSLPNEKELTNLQEESETPKIGLGSGARAMVENLDPSNSENSIKDLENSNDNSNSDQSYSESETIDDTNGEKLWNKIIYKQPLLGSDDNSCISENYSYSYDESDKNNICCNCCLLI